MAEKFVYVGRWNDSQIALADKANPQTQSKPKGVWSIQCFGSSVLRRQQTSVNISTSSSATPSASCSRANFRWKPKRVNQRLTPTEWIPDQVGNDNNQGGFIELECEMLSVVYSKAREKV
jgi:hypothetical protein